MRGFFFVMFVIACVAIVILPLVLTGQIQLPHH